MKQLHLPFQALLVVLLSLWSGSVFGQTRVTFPDPNLEAAVRETLNKPAGDLTSFDLEGLTSFSAWDGNITNLSGLEWAIHLESLQVGSNRITDVRVLRKLPQLTYLDLSYNRISDLTPLIGLTNLHFLRLGGNSVRNYAPLTRLTNLSELSLDNAALSDISFLVERSTISLM